MAECVHHFKTLPEPFQAVWDRQKLHEVRKMDRKRSVREGDTVVLREWTPCQQCDSGDYGRAVQAKVLHVSRGGTWGLPDDLCVFSFIVCSRIPCGGPVIEQSYRS